LNQDNTVADAGDTDNQRSVARFIDIVQSQQMQSWALAGLFALALFVALYVARAVVMPIVMALILSLIFAPIVRLLARGHIPQGLSAALVLITLMGALGTGIYYLAEPAQNWLEKSPKTLNQLGKKLSHFTEPVQQVSIATEQVAMMSTAIAGTNDKGRKSNVVTLKSATPMESLINAVQRFALALVSVLVLFYYFLASGDQFIRKVVSVTPDAENRKRAVDIAQQIEREVSTYLLTVTLINIGLGTAVGLALWGLGVPNPALWGVMVGLLNFIPYIGDFASFITLTLVGLLSFDEVGRALAVPLTFYVLTALEGYFVTPQLLGLRLRLSPVAIIVSVLFWGWLWGLCGALLAVPILVAVKTFCDRVDSLKVFSPFLSDRTSPEQPA